ncbi:MAG: hypothetical protein LBT19_02695 [Candidatus Nomurabacteria bacterium]|jgi:rubrerythrin|nr:hypothetical protein [Candidatus Nomurabacteria bacterium]
MEVFEAQGWGEKEWSPAEFDELTDCAERIRAPLDHQLYFNLEDGDLLCNTASDGNGLKSISETALKVAIEATKSDPRWAIEALRRRIEYDEISKVLDMPDGQMLVLSPTPDAVIEGEWDLGVGYNLTKKSIMMRLWKRAGDEFACRYISLNGGHKDGLIVGIETLGQSHPDSNSSEDWLRGRWHFPPEVDVAGEIIAAYDTYLGDKFGGDWNYGMETISEASALALVSRWPDLLEEHMMNLEKAISPAAKELLRYNYAAAIEARRAGDFDISMDTAGDVARSNGEDFSGYCETIEVQTNMEAMQELGLDRKKWLRCPYCGGSVFGDPCSPGTCPHCGSSPGQPAEKTIKSVKDYSSEKSHKKQDSPKKESSKAKSDTKKDQSQTEKTPDDLAIEAMLDCKWRIVRSGLLNGIEAIVDENNGEIIAVGLKAKKLEYIRQEKETIWLKVA